MFHGPVPDLCTATPGICCGCLVTLDSGGQGDTGGSSKEGSHDGDQPDGEELHLETRGVGLDHLGREEREGDLTQAYKVLRVSL